MAFEFFNKGRGADTSNVDPKRIPPGQVLTKKWPVLHYGLVPKTDLARWDFQLAGLVEHPLLLTWTEFQALPRI